MPSSNQDTRRGRLTQGSSLRQKPLPSDRIAPLPSSGTGTCSIPKPSAHRYLPYGAAVRSMAPAEKTRGGPRRRAWALLHLDPSLNDEHLFGVSVAGQYLRASLFLDQDQVLYGVASQLLG